MDFRIADTFTDSLAKLSGNEQKAVNVRCQTSRHNDFHDGSFFLRTS